MGEHNVPLFSFIGINVFVIIREGSLLVYAQGKWGQNMKVFWLRFIFFSILWVVLIFTASNFIPVSILFFAFSLGVYFLLTIPKALLWKYSGLALITGLHGYLFTEDIALTVLILLYILIDAGFRLVIKKLSLFLVATGLFIFLLSYFGEILTVERTVLYVFLGFFVVIVNQMMNERREQQGIYEELLGEYRKLKRLNRLAENNARSEERTRIARDIHDSVGHRLTALIMKLEMLTIQEKNREYDELKEMAKMSLGETRLAVKTLQTEESEGIATVVHLIRKLEAESHLLVQFTMKQGVLSIPVTNEMNVVLYRVIQEALTNIMRHGEMRDAHITLGRSATGDIVFEITNPVRNPKPYIDGFGLKNMRARVEEMNGYFRVYQTENQFIISGSIPREED